VQEWFSRWDADAAEGAADSEHVGGLGVGFGGSGGYDDGVGAVVG